MFCSCIAAILCTALGCGMDTYEAETIALAQQSQGRTVVVEGHVTKMTLRSKEGATVVLPRLEQLPKLLSLEISDVDLSDDDWTNIGKLQNLSRLSLGRCRMDDDNLRKLAALTNITYLDLGGNPITDDGLKHLKALSSLTTLNLSGTNVNGSGLSGLHNTEQLELLVICAPQCDDRAIPYLEKCKRLKELHIAGTNITPDGLLKLVDLHELQEIMADDDLRRKVGRTFYEAHVASKRAARQRGEKVPPDNRSPFLP